MIRLLLILCLSMTPRPTKLSEVRTHVQLAEYSRTRIVVRDPSAGEWYWKDFAWWFLPITRTQTTVQTIETDELGRVLSMTTTQRATYAYGTAFCARPSYYVPDPNNPTGRKARRPRVVTPAECVDPNEVWELFRQLMNDPNVAEMPSQSIRETHGK